ncbi:MAG: hypothetical protein Q7R35_18095 [Elusimicrobiota bacterium]|nr:hypothetical protein [Elusimicrobiota bacterium]
MKKNILILILGAAVYSPAAAQVNFDSASKIDIASLLSSQDLNLPVPALEIVQVKSGSCEGYPLTMKLRGRSVTLPAKGIWTLESHLATDEDSFPNKRLFPKSKRENISVHIANSCDLLNRLIPGTDCGKVYKTKWDKEWTPPENGKAGQGARGNVRPSNEEEMWIFNMMWVGKAMPKAGTKFLATFNGKSVVVVGGYERGPSSKKFLGGFQREVLWALGAEQASSKVTLSTLSDQALPAGPITCAK